MVNVNCVWFCSIFFRLNQSHTIRSGGFGVFPVASLFSASDNGHILRKYIDQKQSYPTLSPSSSPESISISPPVLQESVDTSPLTLGDQNSTDSSKKSSFGASPIDKENVNTNSTAASINDVEIPVAEENIGVEIPVAEENIINHDNSNNSSSSSLATNTPTETLIAVEVNDGIFIEADSSDENNQLVKETEESEDTASISLDVSNALLGAQDKGASVDSLVHKYRGYS